MSWLGEGQQTGESKETVNRLAIWRNNGLHIPKHVGYMVLVTAPILIFEPNVTLTTAPRLSTIVLRKPE